MPKCLHGHPDGESPLEEIDFLWIDSSRNGLSVEKFEGANSIFGEFKRGSSLKNGTCGSHVIDCSVESDDAEFLSKDLKALRIVVCDPHHCRSYLRSRDGKEGLGDSCWYSGIRSRGEGS